MSEVAPKAVFLSYASQDAEAAKGICDALRAAGVEVWFDQSELVGGDAWDQKIRKQIKDCALLIPIISANTQSRTEGYFRLEWRLADQRTHLMAKGRAFLLPVVIDDTRDAEAHVPDSFTEVQWTRLPDGNASESFAARVKKLLGGSEMEAGRPRPAERGEGPAPPRKSSRPWLVAAIVIVAVAAGLWQQQRNRLPAPAASTVTPPAPPAGSEPDQLIRQARELIYDPDSARNEFALAENLLKRATDLAPASGAAWGASALLNHYFYSRTYDGDRQRLVRSQAEAEKALRLDPRNTDALLALGLHRQILGDKDRAQDYLDRALAADPQNFKALLAQSQQLPDHLAKARFLLAATDRVARPAELFYYASIELAWGWRFTEAKSACEQAIAAQPFWRTYVQRAVIEEDLTADPVAMNHWMDKVPESKRDEPRVAFMRFAAAKLQRDGATAVRALNSLAADYLEDSFYTGPRALLLAQAHELAGQPGLAAEQWQLAEHAVREKLTADPGRIQLRAMLAVSLAGQHRLVEAKAVADACAADDRLKDNTPAVEFTADTYTRLGEPDRAIELLRLIPAAPLHTGEVVAANLGVTPLWDTLRDRPGYAQLLEELKRAEHREGDAPAVSAPKIDDKSVAVLPFANMSDDKDNNAFFADGIQEDVLTNLGALHELRVLSRTSVAQYRATTKSSRQIGEELHAAYVLEGSVRRAGKAVRVTGQLIRAATDEQVWSKSYDRDITDIFAVQSELAHDIARALHAALSPEEKANLARRPTESVAAYEAYLKARESEQKSYGMGRLVTAVALLQQAVELDPKFALAWAELGDCHAQLAFEEWDRTPARLAAARAAIETAQRLAPDEPGVIAKLGSYYYHADRDYVRASEQYVRLTILRPNDPAVLRTLGKIHIRQGRWAEGVTGLQRALALDPGNLEEAGYLINALIDGRRYAEAEALARRLAAAFPERLELAVQLAANAFLARGSTTEAEAYSRQVFPPDLQPEGLFWRCWLARLRGDRQEAIRLDRESPYWDGSGPRWAQETAAAVTLADAGDPVAAHARATSALALMEAERPKQLASSWLFAWMGMAQALLGQKEAALANARHAMEILPESRDAVFGVENAVMLAAVHARVGEKDLALAEFARLLKTPHGANAVSAARGSISANVQVSFQPLWDDPRFQALLADPENNRPLF